MHELIWDNYNQCRGGLNHIAIFENDHKASKIPGEDINSLRFRLVDQSNDQINDLQGDDWAAVAVISHD